MISGTLSNIVGGSPVLSFIMTLLIQSAVVVGVFSLMEWVIKKYTSTDQPVISHTLWQSAFYLLPVLPLLPLLSQGLQATAPMTDIVSPIFEVTVMAGQSTGLHVLNFTTILLILYVMMLLILLLKLGRSYYRLIVLQRQASPVETDQVLKELQRCKACLSIKGQVSILTSGYIDTPVSFGFKRRTIVLPTNYQDWSESALADVLLHELCHLRRNDWLTLMLSHVLCAIYWVNPFVWFAQRRLLEVTESRCDQEVISQGRDQVTYAESLLCVAHRCQQSKRQPSAWLPAQAMFDNNTLKTRLNQVLKETTMQNNQIAALLKKSVWGSSALSLLVLSALAFNPILSAQERQPAQPPLPSQVEKPVQPSRVLEATEPQQVAQAPNAASEPASREVDQELRPLRQVEAAYPPVAADEGIEGWAQVRFTVAADGSVPTDSISMVDAEPAQIFDESAMDAIAQFRFQPRVVNGEAVDVPNVQYVFRFDMDDE